MDQQRTTPTTPEPSFGPFIPSCKSFGLSKSYAYELVKEGLLKPVHIGRRTFIHFEQLHTLPQRAAAKRAHS